MRLKMVVLFLLLVSYTGVCGNNHIYHRNKEDLVIRNDVDMRGDTLSLLKGTTLVIKGGILRNAVVKGDSSFVKLETNSLSNVIFLDGIEMTEGEVYSSFYKDWDGASLSSLCNILPENGTLFLDKDIEYIVSEPIIVNKSIRIDGGGYTIYAHNSQAPYIFNVFEVTSCGFCMLSNIVFDGNRDFVKTGSVKPNVFFMKMSMVEDIIINNCIFQNIFTDFSEYDSPDGLGLMKFDGYTRLTFINNKIINCNASEGVVLTPRMKEATAYIANNECYYDYVSSAFNVFYGKVIFLRNKIGITNGSSVNAFCYDSIIKENCFFGSRKSSNIDLSEQGVLNWNSRRILISNNLFHPSGTHCIEMQDVINITIEGNRFLGGENPAIITDRFLSIDGYSEQIRICDNIVEDVNRFLYIGNMGKHNNYIVANNNISLSKTSTMSSIELGYVSNITIFGNCFFGSGNTYSHMKNSRVYISILPSVKFPYECIENINIYNNKFVNDDTKESFMFGCDIYDYINNWNPPHVKNIKIFNNTSSRSIGVWIPEKTRMISSSIIQKSIPF